eukprot:752595-Hanusia_phi.AAC.1
MHLRSLFSFFLTSSFLSFANGRHADLQNCGAERTEKVFIEIVEEMSPQDGVEARNEQQQDERVHKRH